MDEAVGAFGFGGMINPNTFDLAFEKARKSYDGIYLVLERELFARHVVVRYVNREEDVGNQKLRFAKERLRPDILLSKRSFALVRPDSPFFKLR